MVFMRENEVVSMHALKPTYMIIVMRYTYVNSKMFHIWIGYIM